MLKNITNILKTTSALRIFSQSAVPSIKKSFNNEDDNGSKKTYKTAKTAGNSMLLLASVALFMQKYKEAKCFFGKKSKDDLDAFIACSQYPANNPIEDRYAYGKLSSVDGFAAGVFDGHGGWQVCKLSSGIRF